VSVTFDVWGNKVNGLHGYNGAGMAVGSEQLKTYGFESGGFHDDTVHYGDYDSKQHPDLDGFPLDVFKRQ